MCVRARACVSECGRVLRVHVCMLGAPFSLYYIIIIFPYSCILSNTYPRCVSIQCLFICFVLLCFAFIHNHAIVFHFAL